MCTMQKRDNYSVTKFLEYYLKLPQFYRKILINFTEEKKWKYPANSLLNNLTVQRISFSRSYNTAVKSGVKCRSEHEKGRHKGYKGGGADAFSSWPDYTEEI